MVCNHYIKSQLALMHCTGIPVTWMLSSNGTAGTISFFLNWVKMVSLAVWPSIIMTDCDLVQIKAIKAIYPDSQIFLCIWHVLRTIRSHFVPRKFQSLWAKVKSLECVRERGAEIFVSWKNRFSGVQESILFLDDSLAVFFAERNLILLIIKFPFLFELLHCLTKPHCT